MGACGHVKLLDGTMVVCSGHTHSIEIYSDGDSGTEEVVVVTFFFFICIVIFMFHFIDT